MNRKSMAQEYFILTTDENGNMPVMHKYESDSGLVAASVMDLMLNYIRDLSTLAMVWMAAILH